MPWKEQTKMNQKVQFISQYLEDIKTVTQLALDFGISRKTAYKWIGRYKSEGLDGLKEMDRRPLLHPNTTPKAIRDKIVDVRIKHPTWGGKKIRSYLERRYTTLSIPSHSTIGSILRKEGFTTRRKRKRDKPPKSSLSYPYNSNDCWSIDFKGQFRLGNGKYCYPLTLMDNHSRYLLACVALDSVSGRPVYESLKKVFSVYGLPKKIRSDNGIPFSCRNFTGLSQLSAWWVSLGIEIERIRPGHPEENGRLERFHRTLKKDVRVGSDFVSQQRLFDRYRCIYNEERPHSALNQQCPFDVYCASSRRYVGVVPSIYDDSWEVRKIDGGGYIGYKNFKIYIGSHLKGFELGISRQSHHISDIYFYKYHIGTFDAENGILSNGVTSKTCKSYRDLPKRSHYFIEHPLKV